MLAQRAHPKWSFGLPPEKESLRALQFLVKEIKKEIIVKQLQFHRRKNDLCFAFLMASVLAITIVGLVAGALDLGRDHASKEVAKAREVSIALRAAGERAPNSRTQE